MPPIRAVPYLGERARRSISAFQLQINSGDRAENYRRGWWRATTIIDDFLAGGKSYGSRPAAISYFDHNPDPVVLSYSQLRGAVLRTAESLMDLGVTADDVVAIQLPNWWQFRVVALATTAIGAVVNPILPSHRRREAGYVVRLIRPKVYFAPRRYRRFDFLPMLEEIARDSPGLQPVLVDAYGDGTGMFPSFDELLRDRGSAEADILATLAARRPDPDQVSDIQFTSGTTGEPKGVAHTHNTQYARCRSVLVPLGLDASDTVFMPSPVTHSTGFVYGHLLPAMTGMTAVYQDVWRPERALEIIGRERAVWTFGSTSFAVDMIRAQLARADKPTSPLRYLVSGGAMIPAEVVVQCRDVLRCRLMAVWGMTENGAVTCTRADRPELAGAEDDGEASEWMRLRIAPLPGGDPADEPNGENAGPAGDGSGRLFVRGANQALGYVNRPDLTAKAWDSEGWFATGDIARLDPAGRLRITGREKDIIVRGGENIPVAEVESALYRFPSIKDVALVGYPDERLGERACAVVVLATDGQLQLADITGFLDGEGMAKIYWPERLKIIDELPRTLSGKVQKYKLREQLDSGSAPGPT